jgi:hypothetical protein
MQPTLKHAAHTAGSGLLVLVSMVNKLRLAAVLKGELETMAELPVKKAAAVKFSHGGHLFAAAGRTNHIEVFSTYTQRRLSPGTGEGPLCCALECLARGVTWIWGMAAGVLGCGPCPNNYNFRNQTRLAGL